MKSIFKSKTFWLNAIAGILSIAGYITSDFLTQLGLNEIQQHRILAVIGFIVFVGNIILRMGTSQPVSFNPPKPTENGQPS